MDWEKAEKYLNDMIQAYTEIGLAGTFGLTLTLKPLKARFDKGERTQELYDAIMDVE